MDVREAAVASVKAEFQATRKPLRFLGGLMVALLLLVHGIVTAVFLSGGTSTSEFLGLNGACAPVTLASLWLIRWTYNKGEAPLIDALNSEPPRVTGASFLEFRGRYGVLPGIEIQTQDGKLWKVKMGAPTVHRVVAWLAAAAARNAEAGYNFRTAQPGGPPGLLAWSRIERLPPICVHCAAASDRSTKVGVRLAGGSAMTLNLPICTSCAHRKIRRIVIAVVVMVAAVVGSGFVAADLYPPGNMRGLVMGSVVGLASLVLVAAYRLVSMTPAIARHEGGAAGSELYLTFGHPEFEARVRANR